MKKDRTQIYKVCTPREFFVHEHGKVLYNGEWISDFKEFCNKIYTKGVVDFECAEINGESCLYDEYYDKFILNTHVIDGEFDAYGIDNVNFSLCKPTDPCWEEYKLQRMERGFDDSECWNLDMTIIKFMLPRIKRLKEISCGFPARLKSEDEWDDILNKIVLALQLVLDTDGECLTYFEDNIKYYNYDAEHMLKAKENHERFNEGWKLFYEWFSI